MGQGAFGPATSPSPILEFKAGKLSLDGSEVRADPRKGKLVFLNDGGILRMQWKLRPSDSVEENLLVFPEDVSVEKVPECTTGRVLLMRFASDPTKKLFWWMQDLKDDKDGEIFDKLKALFSKPLSSGSPTLEDPDMEVLESAQMDSTQKVEESESKSGESISQPQVNADEATASIAEAIANAASEMSDMPSTMANSSLNSLLDPELVIPLLESDADLTNAVLEHLPEGQRDHNALKEQLRSPQLQQTLGRLTQALNEGLGAALIQQLDLPTSQQIGVRGLLDALNKYSLELKSKNQKDDDKMDVDKPDDPSADSK